MMKYHPKKLLIKKLNTKFGSNNMKNSHLIFQKMVQVNQILKIQLVSYYLQTIIQKRWKTLFNLFLNNLIQTFNYLLSQSKQKQMSSLNS